MRAAPPPPPSTESPAEAATTAAMLIAFRLCFGTVVLEGPRNPVLTFDLGCVSFAILPHIHTFLDV